MTYLIQPKYDHDPIKYFQQLTQIPRGSGNEKGVSDYVVNFAKKHNLWWKQDSENNVYIKKDGIGAGKNKPAILLQGHLDMVCEKNNETEFDFTTQPLDLYVEDGWLKARGTTLGADNGVAVAYMMSVLAEKWESCPPVECLFTTGEETGMFGALAADTSVFSAQTMINMDCGGEGVFTVSCAGGRRTDVTKNVKREKVTADVLKVTISGLKGGHSGSDIHLERGNANRLMARFLYMLMEKQNVRMVSINGGDKDNAIPRECVCEIAVENVSAVEEIVKCTREMFSDELSASDPDVTLDMEQMQRDFVNALTVEDTKSVVEMLLLLPCGPVHRNVKLNDLVISSNNPAVVIATDDSVNVKMSTRSSIASLKQEISIQIELIARIYDAECRHSSEYPGWAYEEKSNVRDVCSRVYEEMYGKAPKIEAIHAGLECGLIKEKMPKLDVVAMGPTMENIHTPQERLNVMSFARTYEFLKQILITLTN